MKETLLPKLIGAVMNKKVRMAMKIIGLLLWAGEKGVDIFEDFSNQLDTRMWINDAAEKAAKNEVKTEIARVMRSKGAQEEKIQEFLKSVAE